VLGKDAEVIVNNAVFYSNMLPFYLRCCVINQLAAFGEMMLKFLSSCCNYRNDAVIYSNML